MNVQIVKTLRATPQIPLEDTADFVQDTGTTLFTSTTNGPMVVKRFSTFRLNSGTLTVANRCKGLCIIVEGDCYIDGTLTMTARGANATAESLGLNPITLNFETTSTPTDYLWYWANASAGAAGAARRASNSSGTTYLGGNVGKVGTNGGCGGGGGGAAYAVYGTATSGAGAAGTIYSGGGGGGGCSIGSCSASAGSAGAHGGAGGAGGSCQGGSWSYTCGGGGGAGNNGGAASMTGGGTGTAYAGGTGTGGLLVLIVYGKLIIDSHGIVSSNGMAGGASTTNGSPAGGGGSGGGSVTIICGDDYSNSGSLQANGGAGGSGGVYGGAGGAGSIRVFNDNSLETGKYQDVDDTLFEYENVNSNITRFIQDGTQSSVNGHFEQPVLDSRICKYSRININGEMYQIVDLIGDGTALNSVTLDRPCSTSRVYYAHCLYQSLGDIRLNQHVPNDTTTLMLSKQIWDVSSLDRLDSFIVTASSNVRLLFSFDNKRTWWGFYNSQWKQCTLNEIRIYGSTSESLQAATPSQLTKILTFGGKFHMAYSFAFETSAVAMFENITVSGISRNWEADNIRTMGSINKVAINQIQSLIC